MMNKKEQFNQTIQALIATETIPGASWSFVTPDTIENHFAGYYGTIGEYRAKEMTQDAIYDLASLTKVMGTTTRILQLIDEKKISLKTSISEILSEYSNLNCTIEQLLTHTAGLPADFENKENFDWVRVETYLANVVLDAMPKTMTYSDIGYLILGLVIESLDNCTLDVSFEEHIFSKLNVKQLGFDVSSVEQAVPTEVKEDLGLIVGVVHDGKARQLVRPVGSAGLFATLNDVALFMQAVMTNRLPDGTPLFSSSLFQKIQTINQFKRTLGWEWLDDTQKVLYHTGFTGTSIGIDLEQQRGLVLLTNRIHPTRDNPTFLKSRIEAYQRYFLES